jgi:hypothetical protein
MEKSMLQWSCKSLVNGLIVAATLVLLVAGTASAQQGSSPQGGTAIYDGAAACVGSSFTGATSGSNTGVLPPPCTDTSGGGVWFTVMNASLKASTNKTFFVSPSLVTGLYTNTQVSGKTSGTPTSETATSVASVAVRVLLDCNGCALPGASQTTLASWTMAGYPDQGGSGIIFDARIQQLTATLGQAITSTCLNLTLLTNTCPPEVIDLILDTTSAHTFNFILPEVGAGTHTVTIQARLDAGKVCYSTKGAVVNCSTDQVVNTTLASSISAALFGLGSVTVIPVQLAPGFSF